MSDCSHMSENKSPAGGLSRKTVVTIAGATALALAVPFSLLHLVAAPDDAPISAVQHVAAALANFFGPWGVALVRLVDFPNAGMRSFSWPLAAGLTLGGALLLALLLKIRRRSWQITLSIFWGFFVLVWFGVGLRQIADGLL